MLPDSKIEGWLQEDLGHHDVTNDVPGETEGQLVAREDGVAAGIEAAAAVFEYLGVGVERTVDAGERIETGDVIVRTEGPARETLRGERVAVNIAGHASGIATKTRTALEATGDADTRIAATRKTTPGLRGIEKRAVVAGGGDTHRLDLSHMVMVKDNHVAEMGLEGAVTHVRKKTSFTTKLEVEVDTPTDAPRAAAAGADIVLLDNMTPTETARAVDSIRNLDRREPLTREGDERTRKPPADVLVEASGGITVADVPEYAETGVDVISMGSLTHSAASLDYSFRTG